jgi:hypothetical protein
MSICNDDTNGHQWRPMATNGNQTLGAPSATSQYVTAPNMTKLLHFSMSSSSCSEHALGSVASALTRGLTQNVACENRTQLQQGIRTYGYVHFFKSLFNMLQELKLQRAETLNVTRVNRLYCFNTFNTILYSDVFGMCREVKLSKPIVSILQ